MEGRWGSVDVLVQLVPSASNSIDRIVPGENSLVHQSHDAFVGPGPPTACTINRNGFEDITNPVFALCSDRTDCVKTVEAWEVSAAL